MGSEMLERDDLTAYVVAGVPKSFKRKLKEFVESEAPGTGDSYQVDEEMTEWLVARLRDQTRRSSTRTPASSALWRAYSALSAARYHLQHHPEEEERVRELRRKVEDLWREVSPMFPDEGAETEE